MLVLLRQPAAFRPYQLPELESSTIGGRAEASLKRASDAPVQSLLGFGAIGGHGRLGGL